MAVTFGASTNNLTVTATSGSGTLPASTVAGDLLIGTVFMSTGTSNNSVTPPTGWTLIRRGTQSSGWTTNYTVLTYYKVSDGADSLTWTFGNSASFYIGITRVLGQNLTTPIGADSILTNDVASTTASGTAITPTAGSGLIMVVATENSTQTVSGYAIATSNPTWTEQFDTNTTNISFALATAVRPEATATGAVTSTLANSSKNIVALISIQAASDVNVSVSAILPYTAFLFQFPVLISIISYTASLFTAVKSSWTPKSKNTSTWTDTTKT